MRLFVAADMSGAMKDRILEAQGRLSRFSGVKMTERENLHITLKFLGEVGESGLAGVKGGILASIRGVPPFRASVEGLGFFGDPGRIRVVWAGVNEGRGELVKVMSSLDRSLDHINRNDHAPSPHVTVARVKSMPDTRGLAREVASLAHVKFGECDVASVVLRSSTLSTEGPVYADLEVFPLA
jgi:2'-5' RNA ligase